MLCKNCYKKDTCTGISCEFRLPEVKLKPVKDCKVEEYNPVYVEEK